MLLTFDAASASSARRLDDNGFLHVDGCRISTHGVFDYARIEVGLDGEPNEIVKVLRSKETVTDPTFLQSCQNIPFVDDHTYLEGLTTDGEEEEGMDPSKKGVGGVLTNVRYDEESGWVLGDLAVYSRAIIRQIMANKKTELSLGYTCVYVPSIEGPYAATQTQMLGNHLALVDRARVTGAKVSDTAFTNEDKTMPKAKTTAKKARVLDASAVEQLRELLVPALQKFLEEEASEPEHQEEVTDPQAEPEAEVEPEATDVEPSTEKEGEQVEAEVEGIAEEDGDEEIKALLKQLIQALNAPPAEAAEEVTDAEVEAEDNEMEEKATSMDSMFAAVAQRDQLYKRLSPVVGAFDHAAMTPEKVAEYGLKKLGLKADKGREMHTLDAYLSGLEAGKKTNPSTKAKTSDAAHSDELDAYLAGRKE